MLWDSTNWLTWNSLYPLPLLPSPARDSYFQSFSLSIPKDGVFFIKYTTEMWVPWESEQFGLLTQSILCLVRMLKVINKYNQTCLDLYNLSLHHPVQILSCLIGQYHSVTHKLCCLCHHLASFWPPLNSRTPNPQTTIHSTADCLYELTSRISSPPGLLFPLDMASFLSRSFYRRADAPLWLHSSFQMTLLPGTLRWLG